MANEAASRAPRRPTSPPALADIERRGSRDLADPPAGEPAPTASPPASPTVASSATGGGSRFRPTRADLGGGLADSRPRVADRRPARRHPRPRGGGRAGGVPGRPVARAAHPGDDDLRLRQGPPALDAAGRPARDARATSRPRPTASTGSSRTSSRSAGWRAGSRSRASLCSSSTSPRRSSCPRPSAGTGSPSRPPAARPARCVRRADVRRAGPAEPHLERRQVRPPGSTVTVEAEERRTRSSSASSTAASASSRKRADRLFDSYYRSPGHGPQRGRRRDRAVCRSRPDHGDGRPDLGAAAAGRRLRVRVQPAALRRGPRPVADAVAAVDAIRRVG